MPLARERPCIDLGRDAILLDVDGTLLDIAIRPEQVVVPEDLKQNIAQLSEGNGGAVALISGRRIADLDRIFAPLKLPAAGCHGAELRATSTGEVMPLAAPLPDPVKRAFAGLADGRDGVWTEDKTYTLALHFRENPDVRDELLAAAQALCASSGGGPRVLPGRMIVEIRMPGFDKGTGLRALMRHTPFKGRQPVFFGDDITDEDALAALAEFGGLGIAVGRDLAGARLRMDGPEEVRRFLAALATGDAGARA